MRRGCEADELEAQPADRAGSSDDPLDLVRRAGVDLGQAGAGEDQGARLESLVDELARVVESN